jgi:penicillin amidase
VALPNIWLIAGMSAPDLNAVGLMPTGFPIVAIGRNPHLAWAGTSLHAAASDLFDVSGLPLTERTATLKVRGRGARTITLRESELGPVVSDGLLFRYPTPLALRWIGHYPSDEIGAMLRVMRARSGSEFAAALKHFAIPGQNMIHATADGHVGQLLALKSPRRSGPPPDLVLPPSASGTWADLAGTEAFPAWCDPPTGVVASANDVAPQSAIPPGFFYSPSTRVERMRALLAGSGADVDMARMAGTQTDTQGRLDVLQAMLARVPATHPASAILQAWDGCYDVGSRGAVVFEATMAELARRLPDQQRLKTLSTVWTGRALMAEEALALDDAMLQPLLAASLDVAAKLLARYRCWGALHRMRLRHYFAAVPLLGRRYRFGDYASPGGNDTLDKTGHGPVLGPHPVSYGASARFLADFSDPDANRAVLLGGQDGALGSTTFLDQVPLWRAGTYLELPLRPETVRAQWRHAMVLRPV